MNKLASVVVKEANTAAQVGMYPAVAISHYVTTVVVQGPTIGNHDCGRRAQTRDKSNSMAGQSPANTSDSQTSTGEATPFTPPQISLPKNGGAIRGIGAGGVARI